MKKISVILMILVLAITGCASQKTMKNIELNYDSKDKKYDVIMKRDIFCLMMAYPEHIVNVERGKDNNVYIIMKSGKKIIYDDKKEKNEIEKMQNPDIQDMMNQIYPLSDIENIMPKNMDPGRIRCYELFKEVYGYSKENIQSNLVPVKVGYASCLFNKNNKAAESLNLAMKDTMAEITKKQSIYSLIFPTSGSFNYRIISGTNLLSPHSFGIAIDLKSDKRDYWKWSSKEEGEKRLNSYPREVVKSFENNNFVWGGKWSHFDILHFEYRPEIILKSKYFSKEYNSQKDWNDGISKKDENMQKYINIINKALN